jgi:hypothetical protein
MWQDLDFEQIEKETGCLVATPVLNSKELEDIIIFARLCLYNSGKNYGPEAIAIWMSNRAINPVPSVSIISKILKNNCLTNQCTGRY